MCFCCCFFVFVVAPVPPVYLGAACCCVASVPPCVASDRARTSAYGSRRTPPCATRLPGAVLVSPTSKPCCTTDNSTCLSLILRSAREHTSVPRAAGQGAALEEGREAWHHQGQVPLRRQAWGRARGARQVIGLRAHLERRGPHGLRLCAAGVAPPHLGVPRRWARGRPRGTADSSCAGERRARRREDEFAPRTERHSVPCPAEPRQRRSEVGRTARRVPRPVHRRPRDGARAGGVFSMSGWVGVSNGGGAVAVPSVPVARAVAGLRPYGATHRRGM